MPLSPCTRVSVILLALLFLDCIITNQANDSGVTCVHCPEYQQASASQKEAILFDKIVSTEYEATGKGFPRFRSICEAIDRSIGIVDFNNQFDRFSDARPENFERFFHRTGIVAKVKYVPRENHTFTGIFRSGGNHGVLRFSALAPLLRSKAITNYFIGSFPFSFGLKIFRDSRHSGNILTGDTALGLDEFTDNREIWDKPDFNIFSRPVDNMPGLGGQLGEEFGEFEKFSGILSTADFASYDDAGQEEISPVAPLNIHFRPNQELKEKFGRVSEIDFRKWTTTEEAVPTGTTIYTAYTTVRQATGEPALCVDDEGRPLAVEDEVKKFCPGQRVIAIGDVITTSRFYASEWPDKFLFFQHTRMCPKDQRVCSIVDPTIDLTIPDTTYARNNNLFCHSSDDTSGLITGNLPTCPVGSNATESEYCFPGTSALREVEKAQKFQCPFMDRIDIDISAPTDDEPLPSCDWTESFQTFFLTLSLDILVSILRVLPDFFLDNIFSRLFDVLPFGRFTSQRRSYRYH